MTNIYGGTATVAKNSTSLPVFLNMGTGNSFVSRRIYWNTGIRIEEGWTVSGTTGSQNNSMAIPANIYGVKI